MNFLFLKTIILLLLIESSIVVGQTTATYRQENLRIHNLARQRHQANPLVLDQELNNKAETWAKSITDSADSSGNLDAALIYNADEDILTGQNIGAIDTKIYPAAVTDGGYPVRQWYHEYTYHNFLKGRNVFHEETGHFSQVVWKDTTKLGVGTNQTKDGVLVIVCYYHISGNWNYPEEFFKNVKDFDHVAAGQNWDDWMNNPDFVKYPNGNNPWNN